MIAVYSFGETIPELEYLAENLSNVFWLEMAFQNQRGPVPAPLKSCHLANSFLWSDSVGLDQYWRGIYREIQKLEDDALLFNS
jgi:hypothetical protein